jgi:hypothetical protein
MQPVLPAPVNLQTADLLDRELHSLTHYNRILCDRLPDEITLQPVEVRELPTERLVLLLHGLTAKQ